MKLLNYMLIAIISISFFSCDKSEVNSINQEFSLKTNLEYGNAVKVNETLKVGVVVDSIDSQFDGTWNVTLITNVPNNCTVEYNNQIIESNGKIEHNFKKDKIMWLNFKAKEKGLYQIEAVISNGKIAPKKVYIDITVSEYIYKIDLSCNGNEGEVFGAGEYSKGTKVIIEATPKEGYKFEGWYSLGTKITTNNPFDFPATEERVLEARFEKSIFRVSAIVEGEGTVTGQNDYPKGSTATLTAIPNKYWKFQGWYNENNTLIGTQTTYSISNVSKDVTLRAKFIQNVYIKYVIYLNRVGESYETNADCITSSTTYLSSSSPLASVTIFSTVYNNNKRVSYTLNEPLTSYFTINLATMQWDFNRTRFYCWDSKPEEYSNSLILNADNNSYVEIRCQQYMTDFIFINSLKNISINKTETIDKKTIILEDVFEVHKRDKIYYLPTT